MPAKVCPRCGAQYQNLKSTTCPECFAVLVPVDDSTAEELAAARREVVESPEFQEVKAADDERFKEQSFGACLGVVGISFATLILAVVLIVLAAHRSPLPLASSSGAGRAVSPLTPPLSGAEGEPSVLPVAAATLDDVMPQVAGTYRRTFADKGTVLTGTLTPLFHAVYAQPGGSPLDIYAIPAGRPTPEQNEFRLGLTLASQAGGANRPLLFFSTQYWRFATLTAPKQTTAPADFRDALIAHFRQP